MKKKKIIAITATSLVLGSSVLYANASNFRSSENRGTRGIPQQSEEILEAVLSSDYETWKELVSETDGCDILDVIQNEQDFEKMIEARTLIEEGEREEAETIMEDLGISFRDLGFGRHISETFVDRFNSFRNHLEDNIDYETWKALMEEDGNKDILLAIENEADFERFVEAHNLIENGDTEGAEAIFEELGIEFGKKSHGMKYEEDENIQEALEIGDYETWKVLMEERGGKILDIIDSEDKFIKFRNAKFLQEEGSYQEAKEILDELGFPFKGRGFKRFSSES